MKKIIWIFLFLVSCDSEPLDQYYQLDSLRVLDIAVNSPEVTTLDAPVNFSVTPLISDVNGGNSSIDVKVDICLDPGISYGAQPVCDGTNLSVQSFTPASVTFRTEVGPTFNKSITFPSLVFNQASEAQQFNGLAALVTVTVERGSEVAKSFRRVLFSNKASGFNNNPTITDVQVNGAGWSVPTGKAELTPVIAPGSNENYQFKALSGEVRNLTENLQVSWFSTQGDFKYGYTDNDKFNEWTPGSGGGVLVLVVRDLRGGSSYVIKNW